MSSLLIDDTTICAISTAAGRGAIAVIRVSGRDAIRVVSDIFYGKQLLVDASSRVLQYGYIQDGVDIIDYVMAVVFRSPHSYTGEDMVEIYCHGGIYIQARIMRLLNRCGIRYAEGGEFSKRAFLNGKMDLSQAEAINDIINCRTDVGNRIAVSQLRGGVSRDIDILREKLLSLSALLELELDFSEEEDVRLVDKEKSLELVSEVTEHINKLLGSFSYGNAIKDGINVVIMGIPNVGKSTLLNRLLGEERAIVSDIPGTTRDIIEDTIVIEGYLFRIIDTAGIRESSDIIESVGMDRARMALERAHVVLYISDISTREENKEIEALLAKVHVPILHIWNKIDLIDDARISSSGEDELYVSLLRDGDISSITAWLVRYIKGMERCVDVSVVTNARHYDALHRAFVAMKKVESGILEGRSNEFIASDLRECTGALEKIGGKISSNDVLHHIFSHFCIGK